MDCIFCNIVAGEIPAFKVYEDANTLAFMDINPLTEGHLLVIPKAHQPNLFEAEDATLAAVMSTARKVANALKAALGLDSLNLVQANGKWAVQSALCASSISAVAPQCLAISSTMTVAPRSPSSDPPN